MDKYTKIRDLLSRMGTCNDILSDLNTREMKEIDKNDIIWNMVQDKYKKAKAELDKLMGVKND